MPKRRKLLSIAKCRICLSDDGFMSDIFTFELRGRIKELADSTSINIKEDDKYPRNICHVCLYKLDMWCDFKAQFIRTNKILMEHLENSELSDHAKPPLKKRLSRSQQSQEETNDDLEYLDYPQSDAVPSIALAFGLPPEKPQDNPEAPKNNPIVPKIELDSTSEGHSQQNPPSPPKQRQSGGRRTSEQRMASTQRWEARKKALLAATGENDSDTDSMVSDDNQLSPIQKARAKNEAEKEAERQRRLSKAVNHLGGFGDNEDELSNRQIPENDVQVKTESKIDDFSTQSVQAEIIIGDATYIVTSTLLLHDPSVNQNEPNHQTKEKTPDDLPNYQNTDIMDAVQLKRVNPPVKPSQNNKFIERCLNVEVEGTELEALQRVQKELVSFVEGDMKNRLLNQQLDEKFDQKHYDSAQSLDQRLKLLIERAIRKNIENSKLKRVPISKITTSNRGNKTFSSAFIKAAMRSPLFQPKVVLNRVEVVEANADRECPKVLKNEKDINSDGNESAVPEFKLVVTPSTRTYQVKSAHNPNILRAQRSDPNNEKLEVSKVNEASEKHICGFCGTSFNSKEQVEVHYRIHRNDNTVNPPKNKLMRCKRCHEIVEATLVKSHVCKSSRYKCKLCSAVFKTQLLLERHTKTHKDEVKIERVPNVQRVDAIDNKLPVALKTEEAPKQRVYSCFICDKNFVDEEILKDHLQQHCEDISEEEQVRDDKELYQCAICGETMDSETSLENHVEKHLFDDEDDNPNLINIDGIIQVHNNDQLHTCVQCSKEFESELNLVMHMQQHEEEAAFAEWEKQGLRNQDNHACTICEETFDSEETLADHLDIHNGSCHICELCDRPFLTLNELQEHVVTHCT